MIGSTSCQSVFGRTLARCSCSYRIGQASIRRQSTASSTGDLTHYLKRQDPHGRVRFFDANELLRMSNWLDSLAELFPDMTELKVQAVPFWTVMYQWSQRTEHRPLSARAITFPPIIRNCNFGLTIAAVDESHWCHGAILPLDFSTIEAMTLEGITRPREDTSQWTSGPVPQLDPGEPKEAMALFAKGYPRLSSHAASKVVQLACRSPGIPGYRTVTGLVGQMQAWATPSYHVVYRISEDDRPDTFVFGSLPLDRSDSVLNLFPISDTQKYSAALSSGDSKYRLVVYGRDCHEGEPESRQDDLVTFSPMGSDILPAEGNIDLLLQEITSSMNHSPLDWDDPFIVPAGMGGRDTSAVLSYENNRLLGDLTGPMPRFPLPRSTAAANPRNSAKESTKAKLRQAMAPKATPPSPPPHTGPSPKAKARPQPQQRYMPPPRPRHVASHIPQASGPPADPTGLYATLGITPTTKFVEHVHDKAVSRLLSDRRRVLSARYHPDRADGDEEMMARINAAFDRLSSVDLRIRYSNRH